MFIFTIKSLYSFKTYNTVQYNDVWETNKQTFLKSLQIIVNHKLKVGVFTIILFYLLKKYELPIRRQKPCSRLCFFITSFDHVDHLQALEMSIKYDTVGLGLRIQRCSLLGENQHNRHHVCLRGEEKWINVSCFSAATVSHLENPV